MTCSNKKLSRPKRAMKRNQRGFTLIEAVIALGIFALVAGTFLTALCVSIKAISIAEEHTTAESLSQAELEYVIECDYDVDNNPPQYELDPGISIPSGYSISITGERLDPLGDGTDNDDGIQKITVKTYHNGKLITTIEGYKARHE